MNQSQLGEVYEKYQSQYEGAAGGAEARYQRRISDAGIGWIRSLPDDKWMYAKVPVMRWDGRKREDFKTMRPYPTGEFLYYRHRNDYWSVVGDPLCPEYYQEVGKGRIIHGPETVKHCKRKIRYRIWPEVFTVEECRKQIQANHPDRGGDPAVCHLWIERLDKAKRLQSLEVKL